MLGLQLIISGDVEIEGSDAQDVGINWSHSAVLTLMAQNEAREANIEQGLVKMKQL